MGALRLHRECHLGVKGSPATGPELLSPSFLNIPCTPPTLLIWRGCLQTLTNSSKGGMKGDVEGHIYLAVNVHRTVQVNPGVVQFQSFVLFHGKPDNLRLSCKFLVMQMVVHLSLVIQSFLSRELARSNLGHILKSLSCFKNPIPFLKFFLYYLTSRD